MTAERHVGGEHGTALVASLAAATIGEQVLVLGVRPHWLKRSRIAAVRVQCAVRRHDTIVTTAAAAARDTAAVHAKGGNVVASNVAVAIAVAVAVSIVVVVVTILLLVSSIIITVVIVHHHSSDANATPQRRKHFPRRHSSRHTRHRRLDVATRQRRRCGDERRSAGQLSHRSDGGLERRAGG
jgi:hypothetical protein